MTESMTDPFAPLPPAISRRTDVGLVAAAMYGPDWPPPHIDDIKWWLEKAGQAVTELEHIWGIHE